MYVSFPYQLIVGSIIFAFGGRVVVPSPDSLHPTLEVVAGIFEVAGGARGIIDDGRWLDAVGEDDVGVHGSDVDVVDVGFSVREGRSRRSSSCSMIWARTCFRMFSEKLRGCHGCMFCE